MTIQFKITNMSCAACAKINENSLLKVKGIISAKVNFSSGEAEVEYNEKMIGPNKIKDIITKNGYGII